MTWLVARFRMHGRRSRIIAMISVVFGLFAVLTVEIWLWAIFLLEPFTILRQPSTSPRSLSQHLDMVMYYLQRWRLLAALEAVNGFRDRLVNSLPDCSINTSRTIPFWRTLLITKPLEGVRRCHGRGMGSKQP